MSGARIILGPALYFQTWFNPSPSRFPDLRRCLPFGVCPVMVFTFLGMAGSPYMHEKNPRFAGFFQTHGLVLGLLLAFLCNIVPAAIILGFVHLLFYRPVVFYDRRHLVFARKLVAAGVVLFLVVWARDSSLTAMTI